MAKGLRFGDIPEFDFSFISSKKKVVFLTGTSIPKKIVEVIEGGEREECGYETTLPVELLENLKKIPGGDGK